MIHHVIMVKKFKEIFYGSYWVNNGIIKKMFWLLIQKDYKRGP